MPIKDMQELGGFPEIGRFRKGAEMTRNDDPKKRRIGADLDFFRVTMNRRYQHLQPLFNELYGNTPAEFRNVFLNGDSPDAVFDYWWMERTPTKVLHKCDGEHQAQRWDTPSAGYVFDNAICASLGNGTGCDCKRRGVLKILLPDFVKETGIWGYFSVLTGSFYDIVNINGYLRKLHMIHGGLQGKPFILSRVPQAIPVPNSKGAPGDKINKDKHLIYIELDPGVTIHQLADDFTRQAYLIRDGFMDTSTGVIDPAAPALVSSVPDTATDWADDYDDENEPNYDIDRVRELTAHLFRAPEHQDHLLDNLIEDGLITDEMSDEDVVEAVKSNRAARRRDKQADGTWLQDPDLVKEWASQIETSFSLKGGQMLEALNALRPKGRPATQISKLSNITWDEGIAACALYSHENDVGLALADCDGMPSVQEAIQRLTVGSV